MKKEIFENQSVLEFDKIVSEYCEYLENVKIDFNYQLEEKPFVEIERVESENELKIFTYFTKLSVIMIETFTLEKQGV